MTDYISNINGNSLGGDVFDGQLNIYDVSISVFSNITFTADQWRTYSLANIIPDDGYDYEVQFEGWANTGTTSGNMASLYLYSGTATSSDNSNSYYARVCSARTRASSNQQVGGTVVLPIIASDKKVTARNQDSSGTSGNISLNVKSMKRIGTNKKSTNTEYVSSIAIDDNNTARDIGGNVLGGQWNVIDVQIASSVSLNNSNIKSYDISEYLPDDDYEYEVLVTGWANTGSTSGNGVTLRVGTSSTANQNLAIGKQLTRTSSTMMVGGSIKIKVGTARTIYLANTQGTANASCNLMLSAYRRLGTNSTMNTPNICIKSETQIPNALIYGNPTISNGVVSDFSEYNYLQVLNGKQNNNAEYIVKFTTGNTTKTTGQDVLCAEYFLALDVASNTWDVITYNWETATNTTLFTASANTTYWVKILVNNKTKTFSYSTDGENYTQVASFTDNDMDITANYPMRIGNHSNNRLLYERTFLGSVDLNETYINVNGVRFWNGMDYKKYLPIGGDIADGQWVIKNVAVFYSTTFTQGEHSFTVNNYLPEDDVQYEILTISYGNTGTSSGNNCQLWVQKGNNDIIGNPFISCVTTRTSSSTTNSRSSIVVCTQRNGSIPFVISSSGGSTTGSCGFYLRAYRRIGSNE